MRMISCECPCGTLIPEFDGQGRKKRFVRGHNRKGIIVSDVTKQKLSIINSGENHPQYGKPRSEKTKQKISKSLEGQIPSDEARRNMSIAHIGKNHSPKTRQLMSILKKGKKLSKEHKRNLSINHADVSGENHPNWQGGISKEPYCPIWTPWLKEEIKERDNYHCQNPACTKISKRLGIHHINYDKKNCSTNNLITLCTSCNAKANFNRKYWKEFYSNILNN